MECRVSHFRRRIFLVLLLVAVAWTVSASAEADENKAQVAGQVTTWNGKTIPFGVNVQLVAAGGQIAGQQPADSAGRFQFDYVEKKDYTLRVTADGFQPVTRDVDLRYGSQPFITIRMTPLAHKSSDNRGGVISVNDLKAPPRAKRLYAKGERALKAQDFSSAKRHFEQAVDEYPCYARAQLGLATVLIVKKQLSQAEAALKKAIHCAPGFLDAYVELGQLLNAERRYDEGLKLLASAIERSPNTWQLVYQLGVAHYGMKQYDKAEKDFLAARSLNQAPPPILHIKLADVYLKKSEFGKAMAEMQSYLQQQPQGPFAPKIKRVLQQMKADGIVPADSPGAVSSAVEKP